MSVVWSNIGTLDPKAERAAARAGLRQGQRAEELKRMFDDEGADVIALQEHQLRWALPAGILQRQPTRLSGLHFGSGEAVSSSSN